MGRMWTEIGGPGAIALAGILFAGCGSNLPPAKVSDLEKIRSSRPAATFEGLEQGRVLFAQRCGSCHGLPDPGKHSAEKWPHLVDRMRERAGLDTAQASLVLDWVLAARAKDAAK